MATRQLLQELAARWQAQGGEPLRLESVGGVDAARRVRAGEEAIDLAFLADDALDALDAAGRLVPGSRRALVRSDAAVAVRAGRPHPPIATADDLRSAVRAAASVGYSTGPSGKALSKLFAQWGLGHGEGQAPRLVQAPPGVPVGSLLARGEVELGFQQLSELIGVPGIEIVGPLPPQLRSTTVFCGAIVAGSTSADAASRLLDFMASPQQDAIKRAQGMEPPGP